MQLFTLLRNIVIICWEITLLSFVDHQALIYLVNKPIINGQITRWLLLLYEFNFKVIYKPEKVHFVLDQLLCARNGEPIVGVEDQLLNAIIFLLTTNWYTPIKEYMHKGYFEDDVPHEEQKCFTIKSKPYTFYGEKLYKLKPNGILRQCLSPIETHVVLIEFHEGLVGRHCGIGITVKNINNGLLVANIST